MVWCYFYFLSKPVNVRVVGFFFFSCGTVRWMHSIDLRDLGIRVLEADPSSLVFSLSLVNKTES